MYVNDSLVIERANAFIPHSVQVKDYLKLGINEITVVITPPVMHHAKMWKNKEYRLPAPNDVHEVAIAPYTRKPQYQFGWDWALRMNTIGFNKPAKLYSYNHNRLVNKSLKVLSVNGDEAEVEFMLELAVKEDAIYKWESAEFGIDSVKFVAGIGKRKERIKNPKLWWPKGHGEQNMYTESVRLYSTHNHIVTLVDFHYGVKTAELIQEKDEWGTSYYFKINGQRVFLKVETTFHKTFFQPKLRMKTLKNWLKIWPFQTSI